MALTAAEQYILELINRARLDPAAEAARYRIDLNAGLAAGTISTASKQALAPNALLENAATGHSVWMLDADVFSHTGNGGSGPSDRVTAAGYAWANVGEDLSWRGTSGTMNMDSATNIHHQDLFVSAGHRKVMLENTYQEIGIAQERGRFTGYDSSMLTELYAKPSTAAAFLTGVVYTDADRNAFYSIGEGVAGATFAAQGKTATTGVAGGYAVALSLAADVAVTAKVGAREVQFTVDMSQGNVKVDLVGTDTLLTSGNISLTSGIQNLSMLGNANLFANGSANDNVITGNDGANRLDGGAGNDALNGRNGADALFGGLGSDRLFGGNGADRLDGGGNADRLDGGAGNDVLFGRLGGDMFVFTNEFGRDVVGDFSQSAADKLVFDDLIWGGTALSAQQVVSQFAHIVSGNVVFEFSANEVVTLAGVSATAGLADAIMII